MRANFLAPFSEFVHAGNSLAISRCIQMNKYDYSLVVLVVVPNPQLSTSSARLGFVLSLFQLQVFPGSQYVHGTLVQETRTEARRRRSEEILQKTAQTRKQDSQTTLPKKVKKRCLSLIYSLYRNYHQSASMALPSCVLLLAMHAVMSSFYVIPLL